MMLREFLRAHFARAYLFYCDKKLVVEARSFELACKASEAYIEITPPKDSCYMIEMNRFTGIFLMFYYPYLTPEAETKYTWKGFKPFAQLGFGIIFKQVVRSSVLEVYYILVWLWFSTKEMMAFCWMIVDAAITLISIPMLILFLIAFYIWIMLFQFDYAIEMVKSGRFKEHFLREIDKGFSRSRILSVLLLILFLCSKYFRW